MHLVTGVCVVFLELFVSWTSYLIVIFLLSGLCIVTIGFMFYPLYVSIDLRVHISVVHPPVCPACCTVKLTLNCWPYILANKKIGFCMPDALLSDHRQHQSSEVNSKALTTSTENYPLTSSLLHPQSDSCGNGLHKNYIYSNNNNNDRLTAFDPGQPG